VQILTQGEQVFLQGLELLKVDAAGGQNALRNALRLGVQGLALLGQGQQHDTFIFLCGCGGSSLQLPDV